MLLHELLTVIEGGAQGTYRPERCPQVLLRVFLNSHHCEPEQMPLGPGSQTHISTDAYIYIYIYI